ncbi:MAG: DUF1015 domain-containing protein [Candidatus Omnitrophica bacterium]|nr:DUF1015 domain-containing protein [Candidatus Omnitrophota bacterium]
MVAIRPFKALRYNPETIPDLTAVISPPYDVIDPDQQEQLYRASPYNVIRLILGKEYPNDTAQENRYARAQRDFTAWRDARILLRDAAAALYLIEHTFEDQGQPRTRLGFIALLELVDGIEQHVYRHEATLAAPKADRTRLLEAVPANLEPIFCVYPDEGGAIQAALKQVTAQRDGAMRATINGESVRVWAITDPALIEQVKRHLASVAVLIADGHHRFEVAYGHRRQYGALMSYFVSMAEPSLVVRPIHRIVTAQATNGDRALRQLCQLEPAPHLPALLTQLAQETGQGVFGYTDGKQLYNVKVRSDQLAQWLIAPAVPLPLAALDVSLLHGLILPGMGLNNDAVRYTADAAGAFEAVKTGQGRAAWLLRGIPLTQVYALAAQGLRLAPKSTYFYPKVPSGLTINSFA